MAILVGMTTVIDNNLNVINSPMLHSGVASTIGYYGLSGVGIGLTYTVNIGDGILYGPGDPNRTTPTEFSGSIIIDGILSCHDFKTTLY